MNSNEIYTVLLSKEYAIAGRDFPLHGFSYRLERDHATGLIVLAEFGYPTKIILWDKDGPELADLTEQMVKERIEEVLSMILAATFNEAADSVQFIPPSVPENL